MAVISCVLCIALLLKWCVCTTIEQAKDLEETKGGTNREMGGSEHASFMISPRISARNFKTAPEIMAPNNIEHEGGQEDLIMSGNITSSADQMDVDDENEESKSNLSSPKQNIFVTANMVSLSASN
jgi:hypothetical protein